MFVAYDENLHKIPAATCEPGGYYWCPVCHIRVVTFTNVSRTRPYYAHERPSVGCPLYTSSMPSGAMSNAAKASGYYATPDGKAYTKAEQTFYNNLKREAELRAEIARKAKEADAAEAKHAREAEAREKIMLKRAKDKSCLVIKKVLAEITKVYGKVKRDGTYLSVCPNLAIRRMYGRKYVVSITVDGFGHDNDIDEIIKTSAHNSVINMFIFYSKAVIDLYNQGQYTWAQSTDVMPHNVRLVKAFNYQTVYYWLGDMKVIPVKYSLGRHKHEAVMYEPVSVFELLPARNKIFGWEGREYESLETSMMSVYIKDTELVDKLKPEY